MKLIPKETIASCQAMAQKNRFDLSKLDVQHPAKATKAYKATCNSASPDVLALEFYASNHYYASVCKRFTPNEKLPGWAATMVDVYRTLLDSQCNRMMHYMLLIITREARHSYDLSATLEGKIKEIAGQTMVNFINKIRNSGEDTAMATLMDDTPQVAFGPYVRAIEWLFDHGQWSGGYGGKPWGQVARTLGDWVYGKISQEMMVDVAFTLAHNNGPIFNKGMMYGHYTSAFVKLLDVQRSGQIPQLLRDRDQYKFMKSYSINGLMELTVMAMKHMGEDFTEYVDWTQVKNIKGQAIHHEELAAQKIKHPKNFIGGEAAAQTKKPTTFKGVKAMVVGTFEVYPNEEVEVIVRQLEKA